MISYSKRRLRQVRMASLVFGPGKGTHGKFVWSQFVYPATREGFKAYWRHERIRQHASWSKQWQRVLPEARMEGDFNKRMPIHPDFAWTCGFAWARSPGQRPLTHEEWCFRYHLMTNAMFKHPRLRLPDGSFDSKRHERAMKAFGLE